MIRFECDQVNQFRFYKLNVSKKSEWGADNVNLLIQSVLALHAARIGKPYISLINKGSLETVQRMYEHINFSNEFAYIRCMRKTLHLCRVNELEMLHYATRNIRVSQKFGLQEKRMIDLTGDYINELLYNKKMFPDDISLKLCQKFCVSSELAKQFIKYHWEDGLISLNNDSNCFYQEKRSFALVKDKYGFCLNEYRDEQPYINELVKMYIKCYGPVSFEDILWWSGLARGKIQKALLELEGEIKEILVYNLPYCLYIFESQIYELLKFSIEYNWCRLMGYEDCVMKGYMQTRFFYGENYKIYFNSIGEIYPTIIYNGKCIGRWEINMKDRTINLHIDNDKKIDVSLVKEELLKTEAKLFEGWYG